MGFYDNTISINLSIQYDTYKVKNAGKLKNKQSYFAFLDLLLYAILSIKIVYKYAKVGGRKHILYVIVLVTYIHIILRVLISPIKSTMRYVLYKCSYELY